MFCYKCGKEIPDEATFCPMCGAPLCHEIDEANKPDEAVLCIEGEKENENEYISDELVKRTAKPRNTRCAVIISGCVIAVVVAVVIVALFIGKHPMTSSSTEELGDVEERKEEDQTSDTSAVDVAEQGTSIPLRSDDEEEKEAGEIEDTEDSVSVQYDKAIALYDKGEYSAAKAIFETLGDYSDSAVILQKIDEILMEEQYKEAQTRLENEQYEIAAANFRNIADYKDSTEKMHDSMYGYAVNHLSSNDRTTQKYLMELKNAGYDNAKSLYDDLFYYTIEIIVNDSENDITTDMEECWNKQDVYFHIRLRFTGDVSLDDNSVHTMKYELWRYGREGIGAFEDVEPGWYCITKKADGGGAADFLLKVQLDNSDETFDRPQVMYWKDAYTNEKRYD
ncbi:MAG: zinc ribbon domain-containing protein [Lachnospiraceae bacterium]|nr:zinc ribbon domain-containing protein [Lachnospiraceae bacterium]